MTKRIVLLLAMALLLSLAAIGPAAGGPDIDCEARPNHPHCQDPGPLPDHPDGHNCADTHEPNEWIAATDGFTVEFIETIFCVDWTTTKEADWRITIWPNSTPRASVWATVRDSHPGDFCWNADNTWQEIDTPDGLALTAVMSSIPVAAIDACGTEYTDLADPPEDAIPFVLGIGYKFKSTGVKVVVEEVTP